MITGESDLDLSSRGSEGSNKLHKYEQEWQGITLGGDFVGSSSNQSIGGSNPPIALIAGYSTGARII